MNPIALKLAKEKELKLLNWTPEEIQQVMQAEEQMLNPTPVTPVDGEKPLLDKPLLK
jgi:hypothetical protein